MYHKERTTNAFGPTVCESKQIIVIPSIHAPELESLLDIGMITLSGMERSAKHWRQLLEKAGLELVNIRAPTKEENGNTSMIEAVLVK